MTAARSAPDTTQDFLFEIGTEELPAAAARAAVAEAGPLAAQALARHHIEVEP
jgi:glycyl-tRNA synthetase beta subunit